MKIDLSKEEYQALLDLLHLGEVVVTGHRREDDPRSALHRRLIQSLYERAVEEGFGDLFAYHAAERQYHATEKFERDSLSHRLLDEFVDHIFWDQLISRLTTRDAAIEAGGQERLALMDEHERDALEEPIHERYLKQFTENGVDNLAVVDKFTVGAGAKVHTSD